MRQRNQRSLAIFALAIALVATTVAYAVLQTSLNISASVTRKGGNWDIAIESIDVFNPNGVSTYDWLESATDTENEQDLDGVKITLKGTNASINVSLNPGEKRKFRVTYINRGTIDAQFPYENPFVAKFEGGQSEISTYDGESWNSAVALSGDGLLKVTETVESTMVKFLNAGTSATVVFELEYLTNGQTYFEEKTETFNITANFVQAYDL